jgi:hypothetical protein
MTLHEYGGGPPTLNGSAAQAPVMRAAEARLAIEYLQRAEYWAAGVDEDICAEIVRIHDRLLRWIADSRRDA